jgi:hypothetical protein
MRGAKPAGRRLPALVYRLERIGDIYAATNRPNLGQPQSGPPYRTGVIYPERFAALIRTIARRFDLAARCANWPMRFGSRTLNERSNLRTGARDRRELASKSN